MRSRYSLVSSSDDTSLRRMARAWSIPISQITGPPGLRVRTSRRVNSESELRFPPGVCTAISDGSTRRRRTQAIGRPQGHAIVERHLQRVKDGGKGGIATRDGE
jgi:hypothetical protein